MRGRQVVVVATLVAAGLAGLGCETVPAKDYKALNAQYDQRVKERDLARQELESERSARETAEAEVARLKSQTGGLPPEVTVGSQGGRPAIKIESGLLYASGKSSLTPAGESTLRRVAQILKSQYPNNEIRVEGHTDSDPINKTKNLYKDNWDLGAARSLEVVRFLTTQGGIDPKKVYGASYAYHRQMPGDKAAQRRVEIIVLPPPSASFYPATPASSSDPEEK